MLFTDNGTRKGGVTVPGVARGPKAISVQAVVARWGRSELGLEKGIHLYTVFDRDGSKYVSA
jgi:hypothetical protein